MNAVIIGANGLIGSLLVDLLIETQRIDQVTIIHYRQLKYDHSKIKFVKCDFNKLDDLKLPYQGDIAYCCLGTTRKKTPDLEMYHQIDVVFPINFAVWFKKQGGKHFSVVSAIGAKSTASNFYTKFKGQLEDGLVAIDIPQFSIMQPSLLLGSRGEKRLAESVGKRFAHLINKVLLGSLSKYRAVDAEKVANVMLAASLKQEQRVQRYNWGDFSYF